MDELNKPQNAFVQLKNSLKPYIKSRKEVAQIRRILRIYLYSHLENKKPQLTNRPLLLPVSSYNLDGSTHEVKGLIRDYLRCVQMNVNARNEYALLSKEHLANGDEKDIETVISNSSNKEDSTSSMTSFIDLIRKKHRYERLSIIQDYIERLSQKPAACMEFIDPKYALREVATLPQVPPEVMQPSGPDQDTFSAKLSDFILRLEKAVFFAKSLLKREQNLLVDIKARQSAIFSNRVPRLPALQATRDELINWIESELKKSDKISSDASEAALADSVHQYRISIDINKTLEPIHKQYSKYIDARKYLLACLDENIVTPITFTFDYDQKTECQEQAFPVKTISTIYPYLHELTSIASRQKGFTQQKAHLTKNLAKQLEEANLGFDRLAHESHLLPEYPMLISDSNTKRRDSSLLFSNDFSHQEKLDSSRHARSWAFAAQSASQSSAETILEKVENGNVSLMDAQSDLNQLGRLLNTAAGDSSIDCGHDLWGVLNENLDQIRAEISNSE